MEEIDQILDSLPRDEEARRRVREWIEQTTDPEQPGSQDDTPSQSEAASSEDEAGDASSNKRAFVIRGGAETGTPSSSESVRGTRRVIAALGRPHSGNHIPQGSTAALGGPSKLGALPMVPEGARAALGRPRSRESTEESTAHKGPHGKWPLGRPHYAKGVSY